MGILEKDQANGTLLSKTYFVYMGITSLLGYNAILGSLDYFQDNFSSFNVYFYLPLPAMITFNIVSLVMPSIATSFNFTKRVVGCLAGMIVILVFFPLGTTFANGTSLGFTIIMLLSLIWGIFGQIFNSSLIGLSCTLERIHLVSYNIGSSASGIIIILLRMICAGFLDDDLDFSTLIYFLSAGALNVVAFILHTLFLRSEYYARINSLSSKLRSTPAIFESDGCMNDDLISQTDRVQLYSQLSSPVELIHSPKQQTSPVQSLEQNDQDQKKLIENSPQPEKSQTKSKFKERFISYLNVAKGLKFLPIFMLLSNVCANMMYPAVSLKSQLSGLTNTWSCIWIVFMHNFANVIGKFLVDKRQFYTKKLIYSLIIVRFLHFIIFISNASNPNSIFSADWIICLNIIIFSLSAGYTDGALFVLASEELQSSTHKEQGGFVMAFSLTFGIMVGIFLAMPFQAL